MEEAIMTARFITVGDLEFDRMQAFAIESDGKIISRWKETTDPNSAWTPWSSFQTPQGGATSMAVGTLPDKRLQLFATTSNGSIVSCWKQTTDPNSAWTAWSAF
jgi:hypothetical protein